MGNDITLMDAPTLSILSNPAIIAINQDPLGMSALRVWQQPATYFQNASDSAALYTKGETYFWTGALNGGDYVAAFVNAGSSEMGMSASMNDIFIDKVTTGSSKPVTLLGQNWDVYDLWGNRLGEETAKAIIAGNGTMGMGVNGTAISDDPTRYNATETSYEEGLKMNSTALLGKKVGVLNAGGTLEAMVPSHGVKAYRLRSQGPAKRKRDEL